MDLVVIEHLILLEHNDSLIKDNLSESEELFEDLVVAELKYKFNDFTDDNNGMCGSHQLN